MYFMDLPVGMVTSEHKAEAKGISVKKEGKKWDTEQRVQVTPGEPIVPRGTIEIHQRMVPGFTNAHTGSDRDEPKLLRYEPTRVL